MSFILGAVMLAVVTAVACALPGVFVVLRRNAMLVDGIGHAVFPGIIVGFYFTHDLNSPWLIVGAATAGLMVVWGSEWLRRTGRIAGDAPQGLIFPALFAGGVLVVSADFAHIHLDTHVVLVGDINLASFHHVTVGGFDLGPSYLYVMAVVLAINALFLALFYPWLTASTFDQGFAQSIGIPTRLVDFMLMFLVSLTVTAAFHAAGALLVVALMVAPAATASLLTQRLSRMIAWAVIIAILGAIIGFFTAYALNAATSAALAVFYALVFTAALWVSRKRISSVDGALH